MENTFRPYGLAHIVVILLTLALPSLLAFAVRQTRSRLLERAIIAALTLVLVTDYVGYLVYVRGASDLRWSEMLPMQMCDWAMVVIIVAMWSGNLRWFEVAYFWGIGGTLQAVLTPNLTYGFPDVRFISFFVAHCGVIVGIAFLMLTRRYRPRPMSLVRAFAWSELYFVVALAIDLMTGVNYGFLLHKPEAKTLLTLLSDSRPLYLMQMHLLALVFFGALYLPFATADLVRPAAEK